MMKFTIIIPYRDRDLDRVKNCLESLNRQTCMNFIAVLVDFGSQEEQSQQVKSLSESYPFCRFIYAETRGWLWCRSQALNAGMAVTETPYVISTDVDMIFSPNFMENLEKNVEPDSRLFIQCHYLTKEISEYDLDTIFSVTKGSLDQLELAEKDVAFGGFQCTTHGLIRFLRGFDEYYKLWGVQDTDMNKRLGLTGNKKKWGNFSEAPIFHQWHPKVSKTNPVAFVGGWHDIELLHYHRSYSLIRNNDNWAKPVTHEDRPILKFIGSGKKSNLLISKMLPLQKPVMEDLYYTKLNFEFLNRGEVLQIRYLNRDSLEKSFIHRLRARIAESLRWRIGVDFKLNLNAYLNENLSFIQAKDNLIWFILNMLEEKKITDYYLRFDENELNAYLMK